MNRMQWRSEHRSARLGRHRGSASFAAVDDDHLIPGLPVRLFTAFRAGVDAFHSMEYDGGPRDEQRFQERMLERFLTQPTPTPRDDLDYLLEKMDRRTGAPKKASRKLVKAG